MLPASGWVANSMAGMPQDGMLGNRLDTIELALLRSLPEIIPQFWGLTSCTSHLAIQDIHARQARDGQLVETCCCRRGKHKGPTYA
jgi:hypothetical protein